MVLDYLERHSGNNELRELSGILCKFRLQLFMALLYSVSCTFVSLSVSLCRLCCARIKTINNNNKLLRSR